MTDLDTAGEQAVAIDVAEKIAGQSAAMIDAPVSGGTVAAAAGQLSFMCGGDQAAFKRYSLGCAK